MQTAIGGAGTLFGPLVGATVWLYLSDFLQTTLHLGAAWKLVLGVIFVLLVCFLRRGLIGGLADLFLLVSGTKKKSEPPQDAFMGNRCNLAARCRPCDGRPCRSCGSY